eukprot:GHVR01130488.1.p2 GENE.GHVR01130488.1~~GHVR01130488.1.p2  ORF type:complete len:122 (-),score=16.22 GHVR01130488.1:148-513(-)
MHTDNTHHAPTHIKTVVLPLVHNTSNNVEKKTLNLNNNINQNKNFSTRQLDNKIISNNENHLVHDFPFAFSENSENSYDTLISVTISEPNSNLNNLLKPSQLNVDNLASKDSYRVLCNTNT